MAQEQIIRQSHQTQTKCLRYYLKLKALILKICLTLHTGLLTVHKAKWFHACPLN